MQFTLFLIYWRTIKVIIYEIRKIVFYFIVYWNIDFL